MLSSIGPMLTVPGNDCPGLAMTARRSRRHLAPGSHPQVRPDPAFGLLKLYDDALPHVYGYLLARCGDTGLAEDLTSESFLAAVHAARKPGAPDPSIPWLIGVARHKLADHWRRVERRAAAAAVDPGNPAPGHTGSVQPGRHGHGRKRRVLPEAGPDHPRH